MKLTACVALLCLVPSLSMADAGDPPGRVARVSYAQGTVSLQPSAEDQWAQASVNETLTTGDRIYTDAKSRAEVEVGPYTIQVSESTDVTITNLDDQLLQIGLTKGTIRVTVFNLPDDNSVEVDTPNGALALLRAGSYRVDAYPDQGFTEVLVSRGSLEVSSPDGAQAMQGGEAARLTGAGPIDVAFQTRPDADEFDNWCRDRNRRVRAAASRKYVDPSIPGIADLDSAGRWEDAPGYGEVWYPTGVEAGWVPYSHGHWAWVEPWGWTWVDRAAWGFAPFHYGRWAYVGDRWAWVPGPLGVAPVYSPALVAFVSGKGISLGLVAGGGGIQAWFPLGPREPYFPWYHSGKDYLRRVNAANLRGIRDVSALVNVDSTARIRYANRPRATTVVPFDVFHNGQGVSQRILKGAAQKIAAGPVSPHPDAAPTETAAFRGNPPVRAPKFTTPPPQRARMPRQPVAQRRQPPPAVGTAPDRPVGPTNPGRPSRPGSDVAAPGTPPAPRSAPNAPTAPRFRPGSPVSPGAPGTAPAAPVRLIVRNPPPPADVPFQERKPALDARPGRPLEPQQKQDLREGRPASPARDKIVPPPPPQRQPPPPRRETSPTPSGYQPPQRQAPPPRQPDKPASPPKK